MSANLQIDGGRSHGKQFWIEEEVIRIGSDPSSSLIVPEAVAHAVTIQFRRGAYWIYNRGDRGIQFKGNPATIQSPTLWDPSQSLTVTADVSLRLLVSGDSAPAPAPRAVVALFEDDEKPSDEETSMESTPKLLVPLILIGCCSLIFSLMILDLMTRDASAAQSDHAQYQQITFDLANSSDSFRSQRVKTLLQQARYFELRSQFDDSARFYKRVRDLLLAYRNDDGDFPNEIDSVTFGFVKDRMEEIGPKASSPGLF